MTEQLNQDADYFRRRACEEADAAEQASDERARLSHSELAVRYSEAAEKARDGSEDGAADSDEGLGPLLAQEFRIIH
jgi:hypothetical protein